MKRALPVVCLVMLLVWTVPASAGFVAGSVAFEFDVIIPTTGFFDFTLTQTPTPTPEPATVVLMGMGAMVLLAARRRRRPI